MSEPTVTPEVDRWIGDLGGRLHRLRGQRPANPFEALTKALAQTPFSLIYPRLRARARATDASAMNTLAGKAFDEARRARGEGRHHACLWYLCEAAAGQLLGGSLDRLATTLNNIGLELAELSRLAESSSVQHAAAVLKAAVGADPDDIARSLMLLSHNRFRQGAYADALRLLEVAATVAEPNRERRELEQHVRAGIERRKAVEEVLGNGRSNIDDPIVAVAAQAAAAGETGDLAAHSQALLELARSLLQERMSSDASRHARRSAELASAAGDHEAAASALKVAAQACVDTGDTAGGRATVEEGLALVLGEDSPSGLELGTMMALLLVRDGDPEAAAERVALTLETAARMPPEDALWRWYGQGGRLLRKHEQYGLATEVLSSCCRSDLERCASNGSLDWVVGGCSAHTSRAS